MIPKNKYQLYASDPLAFIQSLNIDVSGTMKKWGDVMDDFQKKDFQSLAPGMLLCAGRSEQEARLRFWGERPRGASKSSDIAAVCVWLLVFAKRPLKGFVYASDKDQARLLHAAIQTLLRLNPWLGEILVIEQHRVRCHAQGCPAEGGTLTVESSDVGSSFGQLPDYVCCDEICHWPEKAGADLWASIISSVAKRTNCLLFGITNAGFLDSFAWSIRQNIIDDPNWIFSRLDGQASWMTEDRLAEQRKLLPPVAFARLWLNEWSTGGGDALQVSDIDAAFLPELCPMRGSEPGFLFIGGVDLGLVRDSSAVVVLAVPNGGRSGKIRLAHHKLWRPTPGNRVDLLEVERYLLELDARYNLEFLSFDPWQAEHLLATVESDTQHKRRSSRRIYGSQPWAREITPTAANLREIASLTIETFKDRRAMLFECDDLRRDLLKLRCEEKQSGGFRLTSPRDNDGHGDSFSAFANALLVAHEVAGKRPNIARVLDLSGLDGCGSISTSDIGEVKMPSLSAWEQRQQEYQAEMQELSKGETHREATRRVMQKIFRRSPQRFF